MLTLPEVPNKPHLVWVFSAMPTCPQLTHPPPPPPTPQAHPSCPYYQNNYQISTIFTSQLYSWVVSTKTCINWDLHSKNVPPTLYNIKKYAYSHIIGSLLKPTKLAHNIQTSKIWLISICWQSRIPIKAHTHTSILAWSVLESALESADSNADFNAIPYYTWTFAMITCYQMEGIATPSEYC